ncbi:MAG: hypothetical protein ACI4XL_07755 [Bacillus sp. (in: firmicutes)]
MTTPLISAVIAGILYGTVRSYLQEKESERDNNKKRSNPYLESIIVALLVYLIISFLS